MVSWQAFPSLPAHPSRFPPAQNPLSLPFQTPATQASMGLILALKLACIAGAWK